MNICKVPECGRKEKSRGLCSGHYSAQRLRGVDPFTYTLKEYYGTNEERIKNRTIKVGECIEWVGARNQQGYGKMWASVNGRNKLVTAHRYIFEQAYGKLEDDEFVDHICHNPKCVKLDHLRMATKSQNGANLEGATARSVTKARNVYQVQGSRKYRVRVQKDGKGHHGGYFSNIEDATIAAEKLRKELHGEYAGRG